MPQTPSRIVPLERIAVDEFAAELDRRHAHPFASLGYKRALGQIAGRVHAYRSPEAPLLFRIDGRRACVLNEFVSIEAAALRGFVADVFAHFPEVGAISLRAVHTDARPDGFVHQRHADRADIVVELPDSAEAYTAALGRATRSTLRTRMNRLRREHPDFSWRVDRGGAIPEEALRALVRLNRARMQAVGKISYNDAAMEENYLRIRRECDAMLLTASIGGQLCAGAFSVRAGRGCFGLVNAFDARYARHSLGMISAYLSICAAIDAGVRRFHLGWEPYEYKSHLLGVPRPSWRFEIYRSPLHLAAHAAHALHCEWDDRLQRTKRWMLAPQRRNSVLTRLAVEALNGWRTVSLRMRHTGLDPD